MEAFYLERIKECIPLSTLTDEAFNILVQEVALKQCQPGEIIFSIGDNDNLHYYLLLGSIKLIAKDGKRSTINSASTQSRHPIANLKPRMYQAEGDQDGAVLACIDAEILDKLMVWEQCLEDDKDSLAVDEIFAEDSVENNKWKMSMLKTPVFLTLPSAHIAALFQAMESIKVKKGEVIITQGEAGDYYYLIKSGQCRIYRNFDNDPGSDNQVTLDEIGPAECFGEEALISGQPRNSSVAMLSDGELMRLSYQNFQQLLKKPLLHWADIDDIKQMIDDGAMAIDVRMEDEHNNSSIPDVMNIPLYLLRLRLNELNKNKTYICLCDTGSRSSSAAFLMIKEGFNKTYVLKDGIQSIQ